MIDVDDPATSRAAYLLLEGQLQVFDGPNALNGTDAAIAGDGEYTLNNWVNSNRVKLRRQVLTPVLYLLIILWLSPSTELCQTQIAWLRRISGLDSKSKVLPGNVSGGE